MNHRSVPKMKTDRQVVCDGISYIFAIGFFFFFEIPELS